MRLVDARPRRDDTVFRQSPVAALIATITFVLAAFVIVFVGIQGRLPMVLAVISGGFLLLFGVLSAVTLRRSLSAANWLMATDGQRLLIKLRSYLNPQFPAEPPHVLELLPQDVLGFRAVRSKQRGEDRSGEAAGDNITFLDICLRRTVDTAPLQHRLAQERALRTRGAAWRHYPVTLLDTHTIRVEWRSRHARTIPQINDAVRALRSIADVLPPAEERLDLGGLARSPDIPPGLDMVKVLAQQGRINEATLLAERILGLSTTAARQYVERLSAR